MSRLHVVQNSGFQQTFNRFLFLIQAQFLLPCERILLNFKMTLCHITCQYSANVLYLTGFYKVTDAIPAKCRIWLDAWPYTSTTKDIESVFSFSPFQTISIELISVHDYMVPNYSFFYIPSALCNPIRTKMTHYGLVTHKLKKTGLKYTALLLLSWFCLFHLCAAVVFHLLQSLL